ncbi:Hpt domain-containing protein [Haloferula chungangensis]|uniref:Hpt domain-containing protein n=1 Tax=Haloferula chungangensis TaxID=1048331 RepID=A0ABW2L4X7_9BACT
MEDIDIDQIEALGGFGSPDLIEILQDFLDGLDAHALNLVSLLENGDREAFRESVHRLKGGAQMSGFPKLGELATTWEDLARTESSPLPAKDELQLKLTPAIHAARCAFSHHRTD